MHETHAPEVQCIVGLQWGDEGKGKIVDILGENMDIAVRAQGGNNAGHTIVVNGEKLVTHLVPSGILHPHTQCVIASGVVVDLLVLKKEVETIEAKGLEVRSRLFISDRAHLILPDHIARDLAKESALGEQKIGTTGRGIGPTYQDKMARSGLRIGEADGKLPQEYQEALNFFGLCITDTVIFLQKAIQEGKKMICEGAQAALLDIDHGTYPFVTASNTTTGGILTGTGLPPQSLTRVTGITKAYCTRVGSGAFPSELLDETGDILRERGGEYGSTTGRPRRCGWIDLVGLRHAIWINGVTDIGIMKLDVMDTLEEVKVCIGYEYQGKILDYFPSQHDVLTQCVPVYTTFPGWNTDTTGCRSFDALPEPAQKYLTWIETQLGIPFSFISVGPGREQTISEW